VVIIGGGLAGLVASILLVKRQLRVILVEKKRYPFHRVCGEYISNEVKPFLVREGLFPQECAPVAINELELTSCNGNSALVPLDLGGFGVSRYSFDHFLYRRAVQAGVDFRLNQEAGAVRFAEDHFEVQVGDTVLQADIVLGAFGKRSKLDHVMERSFMSRRSPYAGVKYHVQMDHPRNRISLHNFMNGYCGISRVENEVSNLCYLTHRDNLRTYRNIRSMEEAILFRNPFIRGIFSSAKFVFDKPEVINEISFATKTPLHDHVLMVGDAAGMVAPLCGNGMAMAIHSAKLAAECIGSFMNGEIARPEMERGFANKWSELFSRRLWIGRQVQRLFGGESASNLAVRIARHSPGITRRIVAATHGKVF
jgi:flavin-dependent dehydrogenase